MKRLLLLLALVFTLATPSQALTGYNYYSYLTIANTGAALTNQRVLYTVPASYLVSGNYIQADAEDAVLADVGGTTVSNVAKNLSSATATWVTDFVDVPASGSTQLVLWTTNTTATRDQVWVGDDGDTNTIADAADLDITTNLTLSTDIYVPALPATEKEIISKENAYELCVDNTNFIFRVWGSDLTETLYPNGAGSSNGLHHTGGGVGDATNYTYVDEAVTDDADYVYAPYGTSASDSYNIANTAISATAHIKSITIYWRGSTGIIDPSDWTSVQVPGGTSSGVVEGLAYATHSYTWTQNPLTTSDWQVSELNALQIGVTVSATNGVTYCSQIYAVVTYNPAYESVIAATTGAWKTVTGTYNGGTSETSITDGTLTDTDGGVAITINSNAENVHIGEVNAKLDTVDIQDTAVSKAKFEFEPDEISATVINDLSAGGLNDITYSLAANPAGLTAILGPLVANIGVTTYTGSTTSTNPAIGSYTQGLGISPNITGTEGTDFMGYGFFHGLVGSLDAPNPSNPGYTPPTASMGWLWQVIFGVGLMLVLMIIAMKTQSFMLMAVGGGIVLAVECRWGVFDWWVLIMYGLIALAYWVLSSNKATV